MTRLAYYRSALAAPLVLPFIVGPLAILAPGLFGVPGFFLIASLVYAGPAYGLFASGVLWWSRGRGADALLRLGRLAPLLFAPLGGLSMAFMEGRVFGHGNAKVLFDAFLAGAASTLLVGYVYVGIVLLFAPDRGAPPRSAAPGL